MTFPSCRARARLLWLAPALALCGCAQYQAEPLSPATLVRSFQSRSLDDPRLRTHVLAETGRAAPPWDVGALQAAAAYFSPHLQVARAAAASARAAIATAAQRPLPGLGAPFEYTMNPKAGDSPYTAGVGVDITIQTGNKREYRTQRATHLADAAEQDAQAERWHVRAQVREALLEWWSGGRQAGELRREAEFRDELVRLTEHRLQLGAAAVPELYRVRAQAQDTHRRLVDAMRRAREALSTAAAAVGVPAAALESAAPDLQEFLVVPQEFSVPAGIEAQPISHRADVLATLARYDAAQSAVQLAVAAQYPDIRLGPGYTFDAGAHKIVLSLTELPLTILRDPRPAIAQAVVQRQEAGAQLQRAVAQAAGEVEQTAASLRQARRALEVAQAAATEQERLLGSTQRAFDAGEVDRVVLLQAQAEAGAARGQREIALLGVQKAVGARDASMQAGQSGMQEQAK